MSLSNPPDWVPLSIDLGRSPAAVGWLEVGEAPFLEPFFQQTLDRFCAENPAVRRATTGLEELLAAGADVDRREPRGFIFHMSRCGSTVVANLLRELRDSRVIAEPPALNQILGAPASPLPPENPIELVRATVRALAGRPGGPYFLKFSSWNVLFLPFVLAAFPRVPWVFVYRHPVEVMVANLAREGRWMRARHAGHRADSIAAAVSGVNRAELTGISAEDYCARALGRFCRAALEAPAEGRLLINHRDLTPAVLPRLLALVDVKATEEERSAMASTMGVDGKDPNRARRYRDDSAARQAAASEQVRALAEQWVMDPYERLERASGRE